MRRFPLLLPAAVLCGCVSVPHQAIDTTAGSELSGQTVIYTTHKKPDFIAMNAGKAMFGLLGLSAMVHTGNNLVKENHIDDPAERIADALAKALETANGAHLVVPPLHIPPHMDNPAQVSAAVGSRARFVLDVQTLGWSFAYFPTDWNNYRVVYFAKARLIDASTKTVIAQGECKHSPEETPDAPSRDALLANSAERLKQELLVAADACVATLKRDMLRL
ncbi:MAG: hypothetical protein ABI411_12600 [Tahibacter sp.]